MGVLFKFALGYFIVIYLPWIHFEPGAAIMTKHIYYNHHWWLSLDQDYGKYRSGFWGGEESTLPHPAPPKTPEIEVKCIEVIIMSENMKWMSEIIKWSWKKKKKSFLGKRETWSINGSTTVRSGTMEEESCKELFQDCNKKALELLGRRCIHFWKAA